MADQPNEPTNPMEQPTAEEEVGQTKESTLEDSVPGKRPLSDEMRKNIQHLLKTEVGDGLCKRLSAMARLDLHKGQMNVTWIEDQHCLDVRTPCHDLSPLLYESLRHYAWNHNMAIRFDDMLSQLNIIVRWFNPTFLEIKTQVNPPGQPPEPVLETPPDPIKPLHVVR